MITTSGSHSQHIIIKCQTIIGLQSSMKLHCGPAILSATKTPLCIPQIRPTKCRCRIVMLEAHKEYFSKYRSIFEEILRNTQWFTFSSAFSLHIIFENYRMDRNASSLLLKMKIQQRICHIFCFKRKQCCLVISEFPDRQPTIFTLCYGNVHNENLFFHCHF